MMTTDEYKEMVRKHNEATGRAKTRHEESKLQRACVSWFRAQYPEHVLFSIPNGGSRNPREAAILKSEGVLPGAADLFLAFPNKGFMGLFIEMKYSTGRQSVDQVNFQKKVEVAGYKYELINNSDDFVKSVKSYIKK
jgi:hypothetical protein